MLKLSIYMELLNFLIEFSILKKKQDTGEELICSLDLKTVS